MIRLVLTVRLYAPLLATGRWAAGQVTGVPEPDPDGRDVDGALVHVVALVVAGGDGAELLELAEAALHGVALLAAPGIEDRRAAARAAAAAAVLLLVLLDRDDRGDPALAQVGAVGRRRARLTGHRPARPDAGPTLPAAGDADLVQQRDELRAVAVLARGQNASDRTAPAVSGQVNLGAQPAAGTAKRLPDRPAREILVIRRCPP